MGEQLTHIALPHIRHPQARKPLLHQQLQNVASVSLVGLLLANVAGPNLGCISDPQLVAQLLHHQLKPAGITRGFHTNQRRRFQFAVKLFRLPGGMYQLFILYLPCLCVENGNLLVARVKITAYNLHKAPLLPRDPLRSPNNQSLPPGPWGPFGLSNQPKRSVVEGPAVSPSGTAKLCLSESPPSSVSPPTQTAGPSTTLRF